MQYIEEDKNELDLHSSGHWGLLQEMNKSRHCIGRCRSAIRWLEKTGNYSPSKEAFKAAQNVTLNSNFISSLLDLLRNDEIYSR